MHFSAIKKYLYLLIIWTFLGCKTKSKDDVLPDVSGNYEGIIAGTDLIGVPNSNSSRAFSDTLEVIVVKKGENYAIQGFDNVDVIIPVTDQRAFDIHLDENSGRVNNAFVSFVGDSLTIQGGWRYLYLEGEYSNTSINMRNYRFIGYKK